MIKLAVVAIAACLAGPLAAQAEGGAAAAVPRPGDQVAIRIWNEPAMSGSFTISRAGDVILPRLGAVRVVHLPVAVLQDSIRRSYQSFLRNPSVEIVVLRRVGVVGEVKSPGIFMADLTMTLPDVLALAGGINEEGNPNDIHVLRGADRIRYDRTNQTEFLVAELYSGDQVLVRRRSGFSRNPLGTIGAVAGIVGTFVALVVPVLRGGD